MRSLIASLCLSFALLVLMSPVASAMGGTVPEATAVATPTIETIVLPVWAYVLLGVNLLVAAAMTLFPFVLSKPTLSR
jgi:hypothetical protein